MGETEDGLARHQRLIVATIPGWERLWLLAYADV